MLGTTEWVVGRAVRRLLPIAPVVLVCVVLLLSCAGIAGGPRLTGDRSGLCRHRPVTRLLRRWRIPRVIRHVARSLFLESRLGSETRSNGICNYPAWVD